MEPLVKTPYHKTNSDREKPSRSGEPLPHIVVYLSVLVYPGLIPLVNSAM